MTTLPQKLFVESTTRCNMQCAMCVKQTEGCAIDEGDLSLAQFERLASVLPTAEMLVLNGIGEPLLNSDLDAMVRFARVHMPEQGVIGFHSNGLLLTPERAESLLRAGLSTICLSVDTLCNTVQDTLHGGGSIRILERAIALLHTTAKALSVPFKVGVEFVLMRETMQQLPQVVEWAAAQDVEYVIVSHVLPYNAESMAQSVFSLDSAKALEMLETWSGIAKEQGLDIGSYFDILWKYHKTSDDVRLVELVADMQNNAQRHGVTMNLRRMLTDRQQKQVSAEELADVFARAERLAVTHNIELRLPELAARHELQCDFVDEESMFVSAGGDVHPCYFLWHRYACMPDDEVKQVYPVSFGNVEDEDPVAIWNNKTFVRFREDVKRGNYADCYSCQVGPCDDVIGELEELDVDCHGETVPCGHCPWRLGGLQCLR